MEKLWVVIGIFMVAMSVAVVALVTVFIIDTVRRWR